MRGMFTAGVIDVMLEHNITVDGAIGVSAGAVFGCNYKSKQIGRIIRYNKRFCNDSRYMSFRSLLKTGNLFSVPFCYDTVPYHLDPIDTDAYQKNPMPFYVVCTDVKTGKPVYHRCDRADKTDIDWFRGSASMPLVSTPAWVGKQGLLDGGISDSIPLQALEKLGYKRNIVILTQPKGYKKSKNKAVPFMKVALHKYPKVVDAMATRHLRYNEQTAYVEQREREGFAFVLRPTAPLNIPHIEHDPNELERVYQLGRRVATERLPAMQAFLSAPR